MFPGNSLLWCDSRIIRSVLVPEPPVRGSHGVLVENCSSPPAVETALNVRLYVFRLDGDQIILCTGEI